MSSLATEKKVEMIIPSELRQTGRDKYHMISLLSGIKMDKNELLAWRPCLIDLEISSHKDIKMWSMEK